ncbi:MAG TPA: hypothetical protein VFZ78_01750 [Flavisolibacter sp.]
MKKALFVFSALLVFSGCHREAVQEDITPAQKNAVQEMQEAYLQAKLYNDSLVMCHQQQLGAALIAHCDSMYHQHTNTFNTCHSQYQHTTNSANHSHDGQGMVQMHSGGGMNGGGMMGGNCNCCANGGHDATMHTNMQALQQLHASYHP